MDNKKESNEEEFELVAQGTLIKVKVPVVQSIPLLEAMMMSRVQQKRDNDGRVCTHTMNPKALYPCLCFAESGFESPALLLTKSSKTVSVCKLLDLVEHLGLINEFHLLKDMDQLKALESKLKDIKEETFVRVARKTYAPSGDIPDRLGARDAAAILCFSLARQTINLSLSNNHLRQKVQTDVLFVLSHAKTFGPRIRTNIWNEFNKLHSLTTKQMKQERVDFGRRAQV